ncbi:hypothetical protein H0H92_005069 [Tricholoma furcatifolium]|nr:hypothetical protein H0H92_005069 [Tricholoma furcatifolium]
MPRLDIKGKKREVNGLMEALNRDAKLSFSKDRSNRDELLSEVVDSLTCWLNDIWSVAYEFHGDFELAHKCLLLTSDVSSTLLETHLGGCQCSLMNMPIDITIKAKNGSIVRAFSLRGPHGIKRVALWIWRELFVSMLSSVAHPKQRIAEMLDEIELIMGWQSLERLLYGGKPSILSDSDEEDNDEDDDDDLDFEDEMVYSEDEDDEDYVDEDEIHGPGGTCNYHATHWSQDMYRHQTTFQELMEERLHAHFRTLPSVQLYQIIRSISTDPVKADRILMQETFDNATKSSDTYVAALEIYASKGNGILILNLITNYSHLLRPSHTDALQFALRVLIGTGYTGSALGIVERELMDTLRAIHAAVRTVFGNVDLELNKLDVEDILKLRIGSQDRKERISRWTDAILTHNTPMNPMAFAAMMMGFPVGGPTDMGTQDDPAGFLDDTDENDPDWDDMRDEFRPRLKERLEGWLRLVTMLKEPMKVPLSKVYSRAVELMPFLRGLDLPENLILRLGELHGKRYIARALQSLSNFCVLQRKNITKAANKQRSAAQKASAASSAPPSAPFPFALHPLPTTPPQPPLQGLDSVD